MARLDTPLTPRPMTTTINMPTNANFSPSNLISSPLSRNCGRGGTGLSFCGLCTICTCIHLDFLKRTPGIFKVAESLLGVICQFLLVSFGSSYAPDLGESYTEFLISVSSCLMTTVLLLMCYILSKNTYHLIRSSIFETAFNMVACFLYITSSGYLAFALNTRLVHRVSHFTLLSSVTSITAAYTLGLVAGVIHGFDAYMSFKNSCGYC